VAEVKLKGTDDLVRLSGRPDLWVPPASMVNYLGFVLKVLTTSRYKDLFMKLAPEELHTMIKVKARRCFWEGTLDLEEVVDLGAYAALLYLRTSVDLVDPKSMAKEMVRQLRDMSCGVVTFKQELDKSPKVEVKETPPPPPPTPEIGSVSITLKRSGGCAHLQDFGPATKTKNDNCLLDMKCPKCGSLEPFDILVTCWTKVYDNGTDTTNAHTWDLGSGCNCFKCDYKGKVGEFKGKLPPEKGEVIGTTKPKKKGAKCRTSKRTCSSTKSR
jgi:hypothetical protein